jgi:predicted transcriptional regulator
MSDKTEFHALIEDTMRAFVPFYQEAMQKAIQDTGAPDDWYGLNLARGSDPRPFTIEHYQAMFPYTSQKRFAEILGNLAQLGLLKKVEENTYQLTDLGREKVEAVFEAAHRGLDTIEPLPADEMDQLNNLLHRMVQATLEAPEPAEKWALACSRWTDPGEKASGSVKADQYMTDLLRYRDDAHIAAWRPYDVSGRAWEALTFIWRGDASTAEELVEKLPFRAHSAEDYEEALRDLAVRGWLVKEAGAFKLTKKGKQVREEAEEATDRYYYVGWSALNEEELGQLENLLTRAKENLQTAALSRT